MARYKLTCRKRAKQPPRKHKRIASFIAAYEALCKSDIKPRSRSTALKGMMEQVKSSFVKELSDHETQIDIQRRRVLSHLHIGEEKNKGFRKNHDSNGGDGGDGNAGAGGGIGTY